MVRAFVLALVASVSFAQNPWVNRRNRGEKDGEKKIGKVRIDEESGADEATDFARLNKLVESLGSEYGGEGGLGDLSGMGDMFAGMGEFWDNMMESEEMQAILNDPAKLKETIVNNPLLKAIPGVGDQVEQLLSSEAFQDPAALKEAMQVGMSAFKDAGSEFGKEFSKQMELMMSDPEAFQKNMADAMSALIPGAGEGGGEAILEAAKGLFDQSGNLDAAALSKIPGMEALADPEKMKEAMAEAAKLYESMGMDPKAIEGMMGQMGGLAGAGEL